MTGAKKAKLNEKESTQSPQLRGGPPPRRSPRKPDPPACVKCSPIIDANAKALGEKTKTIIKLTQENTELSAENLALKGEKEEMVQRIQELEAQVQGMNRFNN